MHNCTIVKVDNLGKRSGRVEADPRLRQEVSLSLSHRHIQFLVFL
jgi:hypothetical protein